MSLKRCFIYTISITILILIISNAETAMYSAKHALLVCGQTVIPSIFPFFVISSFMVNTGFLNCIGKFISPIAKKIFRISGSGVVVFLIGILCGYPTGAKLISELYEKKMLNKHEATKLLPFCNNSGPLFVIGAVGNGMLGNAYFGFTLYLIHIISAFLVGLIFSFFSRQDITKKDISVAAVSVGEAFSDAVRHSVKTMLEVCGFVIFFSVLRSFFIPVILKLFGSSIVGLFISSMAEVTMGTLDICNSGLSTPVIIVLLSGIIGFGGICVLLQVMGIISETDLGIKTYITGKLLQMILSMIIAACVAWKWEANTVFLNFNAAIKRYLSFSPCIFIAFLFACAYASTVNKN